MPVTGEELVSSGHDAGGNLKFVGKINNFLLSMKSSNPVVVTLRDEYFGGKFFSPLFTGVFLAPVINEEILFLVFYDMAAIISDPLELFRVWNGGMSFHGGFIGVMIAGYIFCRKYKKNFIRLADIMAIIAPLGLFLGRIGNFINGELYGRITSVPWAFDFGDGLPRHPSQLYEAGKNILIFAILWSTKDKKWPKGTRIGLFLMLYGTLRFMIEFVREPDPQLGFVFLDFSMGQLLCSVMVLSGACVLLFVFRSSRKRREKRKD